MLVNNTIEQEMRLVSANPTAVVSQMIPRKHYEFPARIESIVLTEIGAMNMKYDFNSPLLTVRRNQYSGFAVMNFNQHQVLSVAQFLFRDSLPLTGPAVKALDYALKKSSRKTPQLRKPL